VNHLRTVTLLLGVVVVASRALVACTHDFEKFEGESADASDSTSDAGHDSGVADASCSQAASCVTTQTSCNATCDQTQSTCNSKCGGSGKCLKNCSDAHDSCTSKCKATCHSCAPSCVQACG
jgi:hypothetical protein